MQEDMQDTGRWFKKGKDDRGRAVVSLLDDLREEQRHRYEQNRRRLSAYYARKITALDSRAYNGPSIDDRPSTYQIAMSVVDGANAKIFAKQRPKAEFMSKGGSYSQRIRCRKLTKAAAAPMYQEHGQFATGWDFCEMIGLDSQVFEFGVAKVVASESDERVCFERHFSHQILVDPIEAKYGTPKSLGHVYPYDRFQLLERFPQHRDAIMTASNYEDEDGESGDTFGARGRDQVMVYEMWRLPFSADKPGVHVIALNSGSERVTTLVDEPYHWDNFPFVFLRWKKNFIGIGGTPQIDQIILPQDDANETYKALKENVKLHGGPFIDTEVNAYQNMSELQSNEGWKILQRTAGKPPANISVPAAFHPSQMTWAEMCKGLCYELAGVNEMMNMGKKEAGLNSGEAVRSVNDLQSERFLPQSRAYENFVVQLADRTVQACKDLDALLKKKGSSLAMVFPDDGFLDEIDWADVDMERDMYQITVQAKSSFPDTPAGRIETLFEMYRNGAISDVAYNELTLDGTPPDLEAMESRWDAQSGYMNRLVARFQEAEEENPPTITMPDPMLNLPLAIVRMQQGYLETLEMDVDGEAEFNQQLFRTWIEMADKQLQKASEARQQQAQPAGPAPGADVAQPAQIPQAQQARPMQ